MKTMIIAKEGQPVLLNLQLSDGDSNLYPIAKVVGADRAKRIFGLEHSENGLYLTDVILSPGQYSVSYITFRDSGMTKLSEKYPMVSDDLCVQSADRSEEFSTKLDGIKNQVSSEISQLSSKIKQDVGTDLHDRFGELQEKIKQLDAESKKFKEETMIENQKIYSQFSETFERIKQEKLMEVDALRKDLSDNMKNMAEDVITGVFSEVDGKLNQKIGLLEDTHTKNLKLMGESADIKERLDVLRKEKDEFEKLALDSKDSFIKTAARAKEIKVKLDSMTKEYVDCEVFVKKIPSQLFVTISVIGDDLKMFFDGSEVMDYFPTIKNQLSTTPDCQLEGYLSYNPYTVMALLKKYKSASTELFVTKGGFEGIPFEVIPGVKVERPDELSSILAQDGLFEIQTNGKKYLFSKNKEENVYTYNELLGKIEPSIFMKPSKLSKDEFVDFFQEVEGIGLAVEENVDGKEVLFIKDGNQVFIKDNFKDVSNDYPELVKRMWAMNGVDCGIFRGKVNNGLAMLSDVFFYNGFNLCGESYENRRKLLEKIGTDGDLFGDKSIIGVSEFTVANTFDELKKAVNALAKSGSKDLLFKKLSSEFSLLDKSSNAVLSFSLKKGEWLD